MDSRYTWAQQASIGWPAWLRSLFGIPPWSCPPADNLDGMDRQGGLVRGASYTASWPAELATVPIAFGAYRTPWQGTLGGLPVQIVGGPVESWTSINPWLGNQVSQAPMPTPTAGFRWINGHPARDGAYDRDWHGWDPATGWLYETILTNLDRRTVAQWGIWDRAGVLLAGMSISASGESIARHVLSPTEADHRLSIVLPDYAAGQNVRGGNADGAGKYLWPRCGDLVRLRPDIAAASIARGGQEARVARMALAYGIRITDKHGGTTASAHITSQVGAWDRAYAPPWTLADLEPAIEAGS
jgi:hypothetical protein